MALVSLISSHLTSSTKELKMAESLRMAVAVLGNAASVSLYAASTVTFKRVIKKKSTEEFSCVPYVIALLNCLLFTWYGLPFVSYKWENFPLVTVNGVGIAFELSFVLIFLWYASPKGKVKVAMVAIPALLVFIAAVLVSAFAFQEHRHRKVVVGSIGLVVSVATFGSPLVVMKKVIQTKSVEFMPLPLSILSFLASALWLTYGIIVRDIFIVGPSLIGTPIGIVQLDLHCKYWKRRVKEEPNEGDLEMGNTEENKMTNDDSNGKCVNEDDGACAQPEPCIRPRNHLAVTHIQLGLQYNYNVGAATFHFQK